MGKNRSLEKVAASQGTIAWLLTSFIGKDAELQFNEQDYLYVKKDPKKLLSKM